jgi:hypothetical protein
MKTSIGQMCGEKMAPDYDLSKLPASDADLWIWLQADVIFGQIMANQAERLGFPLVLGECIVSATTTKPEAIFNNG